MLNKLHNDIVITSSCTEKSEGKQSTDFRADTKKIAQSYR